MHVDTNVNLLVIDGHIVVRVNAFDQQFAVKFMRQREARFTDAALSKFISDCEMSMR